MRLLSTMFFSLFLVATVSFGLAKSFPELVHADTTEYSRPSQGAKIRALEKQEASAEDAKLCFDEQGQSKECSNEDVMQFLLKSMGGLSGAGALVIAFFISKLLMLLIMSPAILSMFPKFAQNNWKLSIALLLNLICGVIGLMLPPTELSFGMALVHSSTLAAFSVLGNQAFKQYITAKGKK